MMERIKIIPNLVAENQIYKASKLFETPFVAFDGLNTLRCLHLRKSVILMRCSLQ